MTIGEFSSRCRLSPKVLRSYAQAGVLVPAVVDPVSGYRYYETGQLAQAEIVRLLRRAGVPVADVGHFLASPSIEAVDRWQRSLLAEVRGRRQALAEVRRRMNLGPTREEGATIELRLPECRAELEAVFTLLAHQLPSATEDRDRGLIDLVDRFPADRNLMVIAHADGQPVGAALAFRSDDGWVKLRTLAVVEPFRGRGIGRRLVEHVEAQARLLGVDGVALGTDDAAGFWYHLGYSPNLLFQWVYDDLCPAESEALLAGPLASLHHWRSSYNGVPQLFVELDEPRLDLRHDVGAMVSGCHVGFMMSKKLAVARRTA